VGRERISTGTVASREVSEGLPDKAPWRGEQMVRHRKLSHFPKDAERRTGENQEVKTRDKNATTLERQREKPRRGAEALESPPAV